MNDGIALVRLRHRLRELLEWLHRNRFALAPVSFTLGLASFLLIDRQEWLAQWISGLLILGWLLIVAEETAARRLGLPPAALRFGVQAIQHETFFFALPFFLHTTTWSTGQAFFTGAVIAAAGAAMWDPLYYGRIVRRAWSYFAFHAFAVFVGTLTVGPIVLHLTTHETLLLACLGVVLLVLPTLLHAIDRRSARDWLMGFGTAAALGAAAWLLRPWVPPATLWLQDAVITESVDTAQRQPGLALRSVSIAHLGAQGLYAFAAIRAPRGLHERVYHRWVHEGREVDRIALTIVGGRREGYRAWSYKRGFPENPAGRWAVQVVTEGGQLIGQIEFEVFNAPETPAARPGVAAGGALSPVPSAPGSS